MSLSKHVLGSSVCFFILASLLGCAGPQTATKTGTTGGAPAESVYPGFVVIYHPRIQPGMTLESAANDLRALLKYESPNDVLRVADRLHTHVGWKIKATKVYNNSIEISDVTNQTRTLYFYDLLEHKIVVERLENDNLKYFYLPRSIGLLFMTTKDRYEKVADALYFIQQATRNYRDKLSKQLVDFEPIAAQYRSLAIKPEVSEEQRRLIVQANALTDQKQYLPAMEKYRRAIELDPVAYPGAYFNLALLEVQMNLPFAAITYMKQYLLLVPEAKDARIAQDLIYEWELLMPAAQKTSASGQSSRGYLGVRIQSTTGETSTLSGFQGGKGVLVQEVMKDSPAEQAGLERGDIILAFDGKEINEALDLTQMAAAATIGETVEIGILRNGQNHIVMVKIGKLTD